MEKTIKSFSGLSADYPLAKEIFAILSDNYTNTWYMINIDFERDSYKADET